jgi:hypothetical protein
VNSYIRAGPLNCFPLMESQYAYQRGRSPEAALHDLVQKIEGSLNQEELALGVFQMEHLIMRPLAQWIRRAWGCSNLA